MQKGDLVAFKVTQSGFSLGSGVYRIIDVLHPITKSLYGSFRLKNILTNKEITSYGSCLVQMYIQKQ